MKSFLLFVFALLIVTLPAYAGQTHKIAAVVNDDIVSFLEVEDRMRMIMATTGLRNTKEVQKRLVPQIVRSLVDEKLQMQAARQANITIGRDEIAAAVAALEKQRGKPAGSLMTYLKEHGVPQQTFLDQIEAQLAWNKLMARKLVGSITVTEEELAREVDRERKQQQSAREEVQISSILLPVDNPENEAATQKLAQKLVAELRAGADFNAVATQISSLGATNTQNSWVEVATLDKALAEAISAGGVGIIGPVRTGAGYHLIKVQDKRMKQPTVDAEALFKEIVMRLRYDAELKEVDVLMDIARQVAKHPGQCAQKNIAGIDGFEDLDFNIKYTRTRFSLMSPEVLALVRDLSVEQISEPFAAPDGIHLLMLCEKIILPTGEIDLKKTKEQLLEEKFQLEAMRFLRNLRREAFVEVRL